ncbi:serine/threonine-protein kinase [Nannocystis sp. ILAH1]|nr:MULTISPECIES: serine/threonine-protein kinase [unclassified Nannocystis]MCY0993737.1 serine/threonine-protein kinase [Nannocystis sp. ILAH1]MCY1065899.1 serine/threonine-protein kinase [Nannocystis sp. RBIL2]
MLAPLPALPGFRLQSYLGSGPSGHVYRARDELHSCDVAIKLLDPGRCTPSGLARLAAIASSPLVSGARRYEVVSDPIHPFVVMDLLPGESLLRRLLRTGPLAWKEARTLGQAVAGALAVAHEAGVIHGAVKLTNIFIDREHVWLTDFGIRVLTDSNDSSVLLADAGHLAPEQLRGEAPDERTDLHGLGLVLFELVTGRLPFEGPPREVFRQQLSRRPPAPSSVVASLPYRADSLLLQLLDKNPTRRPHSAARVRTILAADEPLQPCQPTSSEPAASPPGVLASRPRRAHAVAATVLMAALAGGLALTCL